MQFKGNILDVFKPENSNWNLQNEYIIAITLFSFSLVLCFGYQLVLSTITSSANTSLTDYSVLIYPFFCAARLFIVHRFRPKKIFGMITSSLDIMFLSSLIFMFSEQYGLAGATLKSPSFVFYFVFIAIHAMRFKPSIIIINGSLSVICWSIITIILTQNDTILSNNYADFVSSSSVMIGTEIEKILSLIIFTFALAIGAQRTTTLHTREKDAQRTLSKVKLEEEKRTSRLKTEFLDTMNHELRTPMNGILGMLQVLRSSPLSDKQSKMLDIMEESGDHLVKLLNDILNFTQMSDGKAPLIVESFVIKNMLVDALKPNVINIREKKLKLFVNIDPNLPRKVKGDSEQISLMLGYILNNAVKFTSQGSITLNLTAERNKNQVKIGFEIIDTGIGIAKENHKDIFKIFHQVDGSLTRDYQGTGTGLALAQKLAQSMGSEIFLTSTQGIGSTFSLSLTLPVDDPYDLATAA